MTERDAAVLLMLFPKSVREGNMDSGSVIGRGKIFMIALK